MSACTLGPGFLCHGSQMASFLPRHPGASYTSPASNTNPREPRFCRDNVGKHKGLIKN